MQRVQKRHEHGLGSRSTPPRSPPRAADRARRASRAPRRTTTIYVVRRRRRPCFTTVPGKPRVRRGGADDVTIQTGDTVTWDFAARAAPHNAAAGEQRRRAGPGVGRAHATPVGPDGRHHVRRSARPATTASSARRTPRRWWGRSSSRARRSRRRRRRRRRPPRHATPTATATSPTPRRRRRPRRRPTTTPPRPRPATPRVKDTAAPRLARASVKRSRARRAGALLALRAGDGGRSRSRAGFEDDRRAGHACRRPRARARSLLRTQRLKRGRTRSSCAPADAMGNRAPAATKTLKVNVTGFRARPPTRGRVAT